MDNKPIDNECRLFVDVSGSTGNNVDYWSKCEEIYKDLVEKHGRDNVKIIMWDTAAVYSNEGDFLTRVANRRGGGGTYPYVIADSVMTPPHSKIVIITDGQVSDGDVSTCENFVRSRPFEEVTVWFINTGGNMNLSVSAPFTRNCARVTINIRRQDPVLKVVKDAILMQGNTRDPVTVQKYFGHPELFLEELDRLTGTIMLTNVGKEVNLPLRNSLLDLQKDLLSVLAQRASAGNDWKTLDELLTSKTPNSYSLGVDLCRVMTSKSSKEQSKEIEAAIANLIRLCNGNKDYSFDNLSSRVVRAVAVDDILVSEVPTPEPLQKVYECPISMDDDLPTLPIVAGAPVLESLNAAYIDYLISFPLALLNDPLLVTRVCSRFGHVLGHGTVAGLFKRNPSPISPQTREPIVSVLLPCIPSGDEDRKIYVKANVHALGSIFFGDKLVGNAGLWLAVVWRCLETLSRFSEDTPCMDLFKKHLVQDWKLRTSNITLSGLPIEPMVKAPLSISMWYGLASFDVVTNMGQLVLPKDDERNRLRAMGEAAVHLIPCVELLGYSFDKEVIVHMMEMYRVFGWMMTEEKKPDSQWRLYIRAQWQNSICFLESKNIVLLDGPVTERPIHLLPEFVRSIPLGVLISLMQLVDKTKKTNEIFLPRVIGEDKVPDAVTNYGYPEISQDWIRAPIPICPETCRPYVIDRKEKKKWNECAEKRYGPLQGQCCNFKYFIDFVFQKDRYPLTIEEFMLYVAEKQAHRAENPLNTSPKYQLQFVTGLFADYEAVLGKNFGQVSVAEFKKRAWAGLREVDRASLDGSAGL